MIVVKILRRFFFLIYFMNELFLFFFLIRKFALVRTY